MKKKSRNSSHKFCHLFSLLASLTSSGKR